MGCCMRAFSIRGVVVEALLDFLSKNYASVLKRIWREGPRIHAVFVQNEFVVRTATDQAIVVLLDCDADADTCKTEVVATAGGESILHISLGSQDAAEDTFARSIDDLARRHGWHCEDITRQIIHKHAKCPSCGAVYSYYAEQVLEDGSMRCQNCGKPFVVIQ